eukprot:411949-Rhodomonas_salina.2
MPFIAAASSSALAAVASDLVAAYPMSVLMFSASRQDLGTALWWQRTRYHTHRTTNVSRGHRILVAYVSIGYRIGQAGSGWYLSLISTCGRSIRDLSTGIH